MKKSRENRAFLRNRNH